MGIRSKPWRFRVFAALLVSSAAFGLAACGGDDGSSDAAPSAASSDQVAVLKKSQLMVESFHEKDTAALCALVQPTDLNDYLGGKAACEKSLGVTLEQSEDTVPDFKLEDIKVDGNRAVASSEDEENGSLLNFVKVNGEWFLDINSDAGAKTNES